MLFPSLLLACVLSFTTAAFATEQIVALYIERNGKVIELHSDLISPLYDGLGEEFYTAWEADELLSLDSSDEALKSLRIIGWHRDGDAIVIHTGNRANATYRVPPSDLKYRVVERLSDDDIPAEDRRPVQKPALKTTRS